MIVATQREMLLIKNIYVFISSIRQNIFIRTLFTTKLNYPKYELEIKFLYTFYILS